MNLHSPYFTVLAVILLGLAALGIVLSLATVFAWSWQVMTGG